MSVDAWLDARPALKKKLDDIRSRGHYDHREELRRRSHETPLRIEFQCDRYPDVTDAHVDLINRIDKDLGLNYPKGGRVKLNLPHLMKLAHDAAELSELQK